MDKILTPHTNLGARHYWKNLLRLSPSLSVFVLVLLSRLILKNLTQDGLSIPQNER